MTVGSLFAGIGGFDLGFERAGFEIKWQVEIDPFCRAVLAKHWPHVRRYEDVRHVMGHAEGCGRGAGRTWRSPHSGSGVSDCTCWDRRAVFIEPVDVICGGFPCQPHSLAGRRGGSDDERDMWPEFIRLIRELEPRWVVAENVPGILSSDAGRFFGDILRDLAACGYDAEWDCIPASAVGAPHRRDRVWIVAYPSGSRVEGEWLSAEGRRCVADADWRGSNVADADDRNGNGRGGDVQVGRIWRQGEAPRYDDFVGTQWRPEPDVGRVAHGVPARVDRLRGLGNAIVPQIVEWIARRIKEAEGLAA